MDRFIVMTARACMPGSCFGSYSYRKVAVVEVSDTNTRPKQIHPRHKSVKRIVHLWDRLYAGSTNRCAYSRAYSAATDLAAELNSG